METGKRTEVITPKSEELNPWILLGYLQSGLESKRRITLADWNEAVTAAIAINKEN